MIQAGWSPPCSGWYTLNTDGCRQERRNIAGVGGTLRDHEGLWLGGFFSKLGHCTIEVDFLGERPSSFMGRGGFCRNTQMDN